MSGAAGIAAAKNRRTKPDPGQTPVISCSSLKPGSCPLPPGSKQAKLTAQPTLFDEESMQINGPMHFMQVLKVHEKRLNKIDERLTGVQTNSSSLQTAFSIQETVETSQACDAECYERISVLEEKVHMLEEVIMNLQLTLTNVQSFAMESSLAMMKLQNQVTASQPAVSIVTPTVVTPVVVTPTVVSLTVTDADGPIDTH